MHLTQQTDYALRVLIYAATHNDRLVNISDIAQDYQISKSHLMKIVTTLVKGGFLHSVRGKGGGLRLGMEPSAINIATVVRHMEPLRIAECMGVGNQCTITVSCKLAHVLSRALEEFLNSLAQYTLADLITEGTTQVLHRISAERMASNAPDPGHLIEPKTGTLASKSRVNAIKSLA